MSWFAFLTFLLLTFSLRVSFLSFSYHINKSLNLQLLNIYYLIDTYVFAFYTHSKFNFSEGDA